MVGAHRIDIKALNTRIKNKGYSPFSENFLSNGFGMHILIKNKIIGIETDELIENETRGENYKTFLWGEYILVNVGYSIYSRKDFNLYPIFGIGQGRLDFRMTQKAKSTFDEIIENPAQCVRLSKNAMLVNLALGGDDVLAKRNRGCCRCGLVLGFRMGYIWTPFQADWKKDDVRIFHGPKSTLSGPYLHLLMGVGGFRIRA